MVRFLLCSNLLFGKPMVYYGQDIGLFCSLIVDIVDNLLPGAN